MEKLFCIFQEVCEINTVLPESIDERIALYEKHLQHPIVMTLEEYHEYSQLYQLHIEKARQCKRSRKYKKMSSIGKITGTVCRLTHNDGI